MKYETECQAIIDEIKKQFSNSENYYIEKFTSKFSSDPHDRNDPSYDEVKENKRREEALQRAQEELLADKYLFDEFIFEDEKIKTLILKLAGKVCEGVLGW